MKQLATSLALIILISSSSLHAEPACKKQTIEQLVKALSEAYEAKTMSTLDADHPYLGRVRIVIEHSLAGDDAPDRFEIRVVKTLERGERWLRSRGTEDLPGRASRPLIRCRRGVCTFDFAEGISHNVLFLQRVTYGYRNGCPYIKTVFLLDGD